MVESSVKYCALLIGCWNYGGVPKYEDLPSVEKDIQIQEEMLQRYNFKVEKMLHPKKIDLK